MKIKNKKKVASPRSKKNPQKPTAKTTETPTQQSVKKPVTKKSKKSVAETAVPSEYSEEVVGIVSAATEPIRFVPMPLNHYKAGTWFQMEHREEIIGVGFIEDIMGERGDVKVRFIRRHGKACDERITVSGGTIVRRIEEPPNVLVELIKDDVIKTKTTRQVNVSDCLGCRPSAASGRINAAILAHKEPRSVEEISRDCGLPESRIKGHLKYWMDLASKNEYDRTHKVVEKPKGKFTITKV